MLRGQVLATNCSKVSDHKLLQQSGKAVLQTLRACCHASSRIGDNASSLRLFTIGFRALNSIIATLHGQHGMSTAELVDLLKQFFTCGVELNVALTPSGAYTSPAAAAAVTRWASGTPALSEKAPYVPPHARRRSSSNTGT